MMATDIPNFGIRRFQLSKIYKPQVELEIGRCFVMHNQMKDEQVKVALDSFGWDRYLKNYETKICFQSGILVVKRLLN